ncbi:MAG: rhodanese-related sulfurtransferase, partial [Schleiferiaceae bacterium]|nr:rhodanese-related sulfurtransferase [Schleiferiaceae bacterium]
MDPNAGKRNLVNKLSREELQAKLETEAFDRITLSFYKYVIIENPQELRDDLFEQWSSWGCLGRIYVSDEGINAQMNIPQQHWNAFEKAIRLNRFFHDVPFKIAVTDKTEGKSFLKLKVKVRKQIVADGLQPGDYDVTDVGKHLDAKSWNEAVEKEDSVVVDMRNHYESEIGHFEGAILPDTETFRDELPMVLEKLKGQEDRKVLLYCTGGIRCEKTSAYL